MLVAVNLIFTSVSSSAGILNDAEFSELINPTFGEFAVNSVLVGAVPATLAAALSSVRVQFAPLM